MPIWYVPSSLTQFNYWASEAFTAAKQASALARLPKGKTQGNRAAELLPA